MKLLRSFLAILALFVTSNLYSQCTGVYEVIVTSEDTVTVPCDTMVLINTETYTSYVYATQILEDLRRYIPEYQQVADSLIFTYKEQSAAKDSLNHVLTEQVHLERAAKEEAVETAVSLNQDNIKLSNKNKKLKNTNKKLVTATVIETVVLILLVILL